MARSKYGVAARLVWDGGDEVRIPEELGVPAQNQMQGTVAERLTELSGRTCYDSLGRGRSSPEYHKHILEVGHFSVCEHFHCTVRTSLPVDPWTLINRPGIWTRRRGPYTRLTFNPRVVLDWNLWSRELDADDLIETAGSLGNVLSFHAERLFPAIVPPRARPEEVSRSYSERSGAVAPEHHEEKWISLFLYGSRGFSHEQVRHRFRTGVSQRSTRFVDEDGSPWVDHPLVQEYVAAQEIHSGKMMEVVGETKRTARLAYSYVAEKLQGWLVGRGVDKLTSRKQARGAARGYLGNALATECVFSASVAQWRRMLRLRCTGPADAEIRAVFAEALRELRSSRYASDFSGFSLGPSPDGIGEAAAEAPASA